MRRGTSLACFSVSAQGQGGPAAGDPPLGNPPKAMARGAHSLLPQGLLQWFEHSEWTLVDLNPLQGAFAASLFQVRVRTATGVELDAFYKVFAPGRPQEYELYEGVLRDLASYAPTLYARIDVDGERGILLADAGTPLKRLLRLADYDGQRVWLQQAVHWLAQLHVKFEAQSRTWSALGALPKTYPVDCAQVWARETLEQLSWLVEQGLCGVGEDTVVQLHERIDRFYPHYSRWLQGRQTITHGDPHLDNFLVQNGQFHLIDWEYACVTTPQRDISILVQDVLHEELQTVVWQTYLDTLRKEGWQVDDPQFEDSYQACLFDNTLMMLGWEIHKFREQHLSLSELQVIVGVKLNWLQDSFARLFP